MAKDPNKVRLTGENSFLRLSTTLGSEVTTTNSHWRIIISPVGPGHVLFTRGEHTDDAPRIYSDNAALARWLQEGIQASMGDQYAGNIPIIEAEFWKAGDTLSVWNEYVSSRDDDITMTWYDLDEPVMMANPPGRSEEQPHGVYSLLVPASRAQMSVNGVFLPGDSHPRELPDGTMISTCCIALSETWTIPREHPWANDS